MDIERGPLNIAEQPARPAVINSADKFDVIVVGLGAYGSATVYQLAKRGLKVLGIDRFSPPHNMGSSSGETRITRAAIGEGVEYTPLALHSHKIWREIEAEWHENNKAKEIKELFVQCGCLMVGKKGKPVRHVDDFFGNIHEAAKQYGIPSEDFSAAQLRARFPLNVRDDEIGFLDKAGGYLLAENCIGAQLELAEKYGATIIKNTVVDKFESSPNGTTVMTDKRKFFADRLVLTVGPWMPDFLPDDIKQHLKPTRQVMQWFQIHSDPKRFSSDAFPVFICDAMGSDASKANIYGFPIIKNGKPWLKVTHEEVGHAISPNDVNPKASAKENKYTFMNYIQERLPDVGPRVMRSQPCIYTRAPLSRFIIDFLPDHHGRVIFASPCSGHGFKFSAAIGNFLASSLASSKKVFDTQSRREIWAKDKNLNVPPARPSRVNISTFLSHFSVAELQKRIARQNTEPTLHL